jgi:hypothetical protein
MKSYQTCYPNSEGDPIYETMTEDQIIEFYWTYWSSQMRKVGRPEEMITRENCIEDFVIIHWAWEVDGK